MIYASIPLWLAAATITILACIGFKGWYKPTGDMGHLIAGQVILFLIAGAIAAVAAKMCGI